MISAIVPRPIAFVSTISAAGHTNAAPFSYFTGVSSSPLSLLICAGRRRDGLKDTQRNIVETGEFVVNVVVEEMMDAVVIGGADQAPGISEIELAGLRTEPAVKVRPPLIADSPVKMECRMSHLFEAAGAAIIVGEVVWIHVRDDLLMHGAERGAGAGAGRHRLDPNRLKPIARLGGDFYTRLGEVFEKGK
ncbi:MAG TPA: flavin reductase family protein [Candidatus Polarisedimenticolia bacterium]|nr:flavin reductase family protein [Candidatus Polarisedimenticolia bacterium]